MFSTYVVNTPVYIKGLVSHVGFIFAMVSGYCRLTNTIDTKQPLKAKQDMFMKITT